MELIAKIANDDKINVSLSKEDRQYLYTLLRSEYEGKILEDLTDEIKDRCEFHLREIIFSLTDKFLSDISKDLSNKISEVINRKIDSIIENEKMKLKSIPFLLENNVVFGRSPFKDEGEAEEYVKKSYESAGYKCKRSKNGGYADYYVTVPFIEYQNALKDEIGIPDLIIWNDKEAFFVEIKLSTGILSAVQILWYLSHSNLKIKVCIVSTDNKDLDVIKWQLGNSLKQSKG